MRKPSWRNWQRNSFPNYGLRVRIPLTAQSTVGMWPVLYRMRQIYTIERAELLPSALQICELSKLHCLFCYGVVVLSDLQLYSVTGLLSLVNVFHCRAIRDSGRKYQPTPG